MPMAGPLFTGPIPSNVPIATPCLTPYLTPYPGTPFSLPGLQTPDSHQYSDGNAHPGGPLPPEGFQVGPWSYGQAGIDPHHWSSFGQPWYAYQTSASEGQYAAQGYYPYQMPPAFANPYFSPAGWQMGPQPLSMAAPRPGRDGTPVMTRKTRNSAAVEIKDPAGSSTRVAQPSATPSLVDKRTLGDQKSQQQKPEQKPEQTQRQKPLSEPSNKESLSSRPGTTPPSGPTEPAARRQQRAERGELPPEPQVASMSKTAPYETRALCQSKRWVSQEAQERAAFNRLKQNLHHMGAANSPFLPQTPAALAAFHQVVADRKSQRLQKQLVEAVVRQAAAVRAGVAGQKKPKLFGDREINDGLSAIFAQESCFNMDKLPRVLAQWPSAAEFKTAGTAGEDKTCARHYPLPRMGTVDDGDGPVSDGTVGQHPLGFISPVCPEDEAEQSSAPVAEFDKLHEHLQALLQEIDDDTC